MKAGKLVLFLMAGGLFGMGLAISGMTDPGRVIGFLDLFGAWDPALLFVMAGAVGVYGLGMLILRRFQSADRRATGPKTGAVSVDRSSACQDSRWQFLIAAARDLSLLPTRK